MASPYDQPTHDEINLVRLLRRLDKSVANTDEWRPGDGLSLEEVWLKAQKTTQKLRYARTLIKTIEIESEETSGRIQRLNDAKIQLDRLESLLAGIEQASQPNVPKRQSLLATLPIPKPPSPVEEKPSTLYDLSLVDSVVSPTLGSAATEKVKSPDKPRKELFIDPPKPDEISPLIETALPSLLPLNPSETAKSSAFSRTFGPSPSTRNIAAATGNQATTSLHEELSSQLEQMAQQLKRNAIHFSTSLAKDKAVVEEAAQKLESNFDVMQSQRVKLRDRKSQSRSNTCLTMGIILVVILVFMLMISVIRFL